MNRNVEQLKKNVEQWKRKAGLLQRENDILKEKLAKYENPKNSNNSSVPPSKDENRPFISMLDSKVIDLVLMCLQTCCDVPNAFPVGKLSKNHREKLAPATEVFYLIISIIAIDTFIKLITDKHGIELSKNILSLIHDI